jgi:hypothetical protein
MKGARAAATASVLPATLASPPSVRVEPAPDVIPIALSKSLPAAADVVAAVFPAPPLPVASASVATSMAMSATPIPASAPPDVAPPPVPSAPVQPEATSVAPPAPVATASGTLKPAPDVAAPPGATSALQPDPVVAASATLNPTPAPPPPPSVANAGLEPVGEPSRPEDAFPDGARAQAPATDPKSVTASHRLAEEDAWRASSQPPPFAAPSIAVAPSPAHPVRVPMAGSHQTALPATPARAERGSQSSPVAEPRMPANTETARPRLVAAAIEPRIAAQRCRSIMRRALMEDLTNDERVFLRGGCKADR